MPVKIRLTRMGKKKQPTYRVVVMDSRKPRDGKYLEQIGRYDPRQNPSVIEIDNDRALSWLRQGAQPSDRARKLLEISGAWTQFKVAKGEIHTIGDASAPAVAPTGEIHVVGGPEERSRTTPSPRSSPKPMTPSLRPKPGRWPRRPKRSRPRSTLRRPGTYRPRMTPPNRSKGVTHDAGSDR